MARPCNVGPVPPTADDDIYAAICKQIESGDPKMPLNLGEYFLKESASGVDAPSMLKMVDLITCLHRAQPECRFKPTQLASVVLLVIAAKPTLPLNRSTYGNKQFSKCVAQSIIKLMYDYRKLRRDGPARDAARATLRCLFVAIVAVLIAAYLSAYLPTYLTTYLRRRVVLPPAVVRPSVSSRLARGRP